MDSQLKECKGHLVGRNNILHTTSIGYQYNKYLGVFWVGQMDWFVVDRSVDSLSYRI